MKNLSILIIDDEASPLLSLRGFLSRRQFQVFTAASGPEGWRVAQKNVVDVVLTDFRMPEWDGLKVLEEIKALNPKDET